MMARAERAMTVAGIMSGTSADGIDVALVRLSPDRKHGSELPRLAFLGHRHDRFPPALRDAVLSAMNAERTSTAELARLHWRLGLAYAEALASISRQLRIPLDLVGCHGQTIYHQPRPRLYCGRKVACTWQIGEMALVAASAGVPVVSNFRPADMAAGGEGAPLVPLLDFVLYRHPHRGRVLQNLGGIGNLTAVPPNAEISQITAFDTGPANMVIDYLMRKLFLKEFDRGGTTASRGRILEPVVRTFLRQRFFHARPPKTAGREQFGRAFAERFLAGCRRAGGSPADAVASATALTASSIRQAYNEFVRERMGKAGVDFILSGGGARNRTLVALLQKELAPLGCRVSTSDHYGIPAEAKEAVAFALLAYQTWHNRPGNVPSATGAAHPVILGEIHQPFTEQLGKYGVSGRKTKTPR